MSWTVGMHFKRFFFYSKGREPDNMWFRLFIRFTSALYCLAFIHLQFIVTSSCLCILKLMIQVLVFLWNQIYASTFRSRRPSMKPDPCRLKAVEEMFDEDFSLSLHRNYLLNVCIFSLSHKYTVPLYYFIFNWNTVEDNEGGNKKL
jgi:hypothetical protein